MKISRNQKLIPCQANFSLHPSILGTLVSGEAVSCKLLNRADNIRQTKVNVNILLVDIMCNVYVDIYQTMAWTLPMS